MTTPHETADRTRWHCRREVAELRGVSVDTVKRDERRGRYPNKRTRPGDLNATVEIPEDDLVAAGDLRSARPQEPAAASASGGQSDDAPLRLEVARLSVRCEELTDQLKQAREEVGWLRKQLERQVTGRAA